MEKAAKGLLVLVAVAHTWFLVLEMFLWTTAYGLKTFNLTPEVAASSATLAANQGLYNGFLAAGLLWAAFTKRAEQAFSLRVFFLGCVIVAGMYGAISSKVVILFVQAVPAALALGACVAANKGKPNQA